MEHSCRYFFMYIWMKSNEKYALILAWFFDEWFFSPSWNFHLKITYYFSSRFHFDYVALGVNYVFYTEEKVLWVFLSNPESFIDWSLQFLWARSIKSWQWIFPKCTKAKLQRNRYKIINLFADTFYSRRCVQNIKLSHCWEAEIIDCLFLICLLRSFVELVFSSADSLWAVCSC